MASRTKGIEASPQALVNAGEAIDRTLGGKRGDFRELSQPFGEGMQVTVSDQSPQQSWTHARFQLSIIGEDFDVTMRAEDGRSGSDDPDRSFVLREKSGDKWTSSDEYSGNSRPNWASRFLIELTMAKKAVKKSS